MAAGCFTHCYLISEGHPFQVMLVQCIVHTRDNADAAALVNILLHIYQISKCGMMELMGSIKIYVLLLQSFYSSSYNNDGTTVFIARL